MSNEITTLLTGINTRVLAVLGSSYSELGYIVDVTDNPFKGSSKSYGTLAGDVSEVETSAGVLGSYTVTQNFTVKVTNKWATSQAGDSSKRSTMVALLEKCLLIYKDLVNNKAGSPNIVLNVLDGMETVNTFHDEENVCEATMSIGILYRIAL